MLATCSVVRFGFGRHSWLSSSSRRYGCLLSPNSPFSGVSWAPFLGFTVNWQMSLYHTWPLAPLAPLWSIAVEMQFYLLAPLLYRALRSSSRGVIIALIFVAANALRVCRVGLETGSGNGGLYYATYAYADVFVAGALVAHWRAEGGRLGEVQREPLLASLPCCRRPF